MAYREDIWKLLGKRDGWRCHVNTPLFSVVKSVFHYQLCRFLSVFLLLCVSHTQPPLWKLLSDSEELNLDWRQTLKPEHWLLTSLSSLPAESAGSLRSFPIQTLLTDDLGLIRTVLDLAKTGKRIIIVLNIFIGRRQISLFICCAEIQNPPASYWWVWWEVSDLCHLISWNYF